MCGEGTLLEQKLPPGFEEHSALSPVIPLLGYILGDSPVCAERKPNKSLYSSVSITAKN